MSWTQVNIALARTQDAPLAQARLVFDALIPLVDESRDAGALEHFHFMRKPPGIRMRLEGLSVGDDLLPAVEAALHRLTKDGAVMQYSTSVYEPEYRLFGGVRSMALVHDHFDVDSRAWVEYDRLQRSGAARLSPDDLTTGVINDLFALTVEDRGEVWDTWCNVCHLLGEELATVTDDPPPVHLVEGLSWAASAGERALLARYHAANAVLASGLRALAHDGQLECGLRGLLPFVAIFHFHRYGLVQQRQAAQALAMRSAWDPRLGMKGARLPPAPTSST